MKKRLVCWFYFLGKQVFALVAQIKALLQ